MDRPDRPAGGFDLARLTTGQKGLLVTALLLFISLFLPWQGFDFGEFFGEQIGGNISGFSGLGILVAILALAVLAWEGLLAFGVNIQTGTVSPALIGAGIAAATVLFGLIKFLTSLSAIRWGAFVGLIIILAMAYFAWVRFQEGQARTA